jgi:predicted O-methyltransferase YrrM
MTLTSDASHPTALGRQQFRQAARQLRMLLFHPSGLDKLELLRGLPFIERPIWWLEQRHPTLYGAILTALGLYRPIFIDHPPRHPEASHRPQGHPMISVMLEAQREHYAELLDCLLAQIPRLSTVAVRGSRDGTAPYWDNGWLPPLDAFALYGFVARLNPGRYVEIGSGSSTKFARRAITDHGLRTQITSIDPKPRAAVDALCDTVIRQPLELADLSLFSDLEAGDIVFFDGSHRVFSGSDVTTFFLEVLPRLRPGVFVHVHDVFLPADYPPEWRWRYYSEQHLLAAFLLASPGLFSVEWPAAFINGDAELRARLDPLRRQIAPAPEYQPASFWLRLCADLAAPGTGRS